MVGRCFVSCDLFCAVEQFSFRIYCAEEKIIYFASQWVTIKRKRATERKKEEEKISYAVTPHQGPPNTCPASFSPRPPTRCAIGRCPIPLADATLPEPTAHAPPRPPAPVPWDWDPDPRAPRRARGRPRVLRSFSPRWAQLTDGPRAAWRAPRLPCFTPRLGIFASSPPRTRRSLRCGPGTLPRPGRPCVVAVPAQASCGRCGARDLFLALLAPSPPASPFYFYFYLSEPPSLRPRPAVRTPPSRFGEPAAASPSSSRGCSHRGAAEQRKVSGIPIFFSLLPLLLPPHSQKCSSIGAVRV